MNSHGGSFIAILDKLCEKVRFNPSAKSIDPCYPAWFGQVDNGRNLYQ